MSPYQQRRSILSRFHNRDRELGLGLPGRAQGTVPAAGRGAGGRDCPKVSQDRASSQGPSKQGDTTGTALRF
jgi:hypothetical protein